MNTLEQTMEELIAEGKQYLIPTYNPLPIVLERGEGCYVWDTNGKKYLDLVAGIAVNSLGGNHPAVVKAIQEQAAQIIHCSNLYWIKPQIKLAKLLVEKSGLDKAFFCNSGAEANEAAIKLARKWGQGEKYEIITLEKSFHGRTLGSLAATGQEKYQKAFRPLPAGFSAVPAGDLTALEQEIRPTTCAIMLEIIQGEGGINLPSPEYLQGIQELCQKYKLLLIIDEVQTGMGRTGKAFAFQHYGLKPDIISMAKALGNGVPLGAIAAKAEIADCFTPGDHGTTFGGNPLATAAGLASAEILLADDFLAQVTANGTYFQNALKDLQAQHPDKIADVRGLGLMLGCELTINAKDVSAQLLEQGVLVNTIGEHILRFVPPLIITKTEIDEFISLFKDILN